jgi:hypothetical protein
MKTKLYFFIPLFTFFLLLTPLSVNATYQIPSCGTDYSNAAELKEGENTGGAVGEGETCYYYINSKPGYELNIDYKITGESFFGSVSLYDNDKNEIVSSVDGEDILRWLGSGSEDSRYYLVIDNSYGTDSQIFNISFVDRTDADSGTDAESDFGKAVDIPYGGYTGYLSSFIYGAVGGNDESDYYKTSVGKGDKVTIKVTPVGDFEVGCAIYDSNRSELFNEEGLDIETGAIIQKTLSIQSNGYIYVVVKQSSFGEKYDSIDQYTLLVTNEDVEKLGGEVVDDSDTVDDIVVIEEDTVDGSTSSTKDILIKISLVALVMFVIALIVLLVVRQMKKKEQVTKKKDIVVDDTKKVEKKIPQKNDREDFSKVKVTVEEGTDVEINTIETDKDNTKSST